MPLEGLFYRIPTPTASYDCPLCGTTTTGLEVERDEDGAYVDPELAPCNDDHCTAKLCPSCPQFVCDGCGLTHCLDHAVLVDEGTKTQLQVCPVCAIVSTLSEPDEAICNRCSSTWDAAGLQEVPNEGPCCPACRKALVLREVREDEQANRGCE
jgi:hypothetical protein